MRRSAYAGVGLAVLALGAAGCGSSNNDNSSASTPASTPAAPATSTPAASTPAAAAGGGTVTLGETEFKITPAAATTKSGKVTIDVKNAGTTVHNLNVEGNGIEEQKTADLQPGDSGKLTLDLKPGKYEMYCSIDGHRASGMEGTITVS